MSVVVLLGKLVNGTAGIGGKPQAPAIQKIQNVKPCVKKKFSKGKLRGIGTTGKQAHTHLSAS
jgi:hypothetical protein